ncbi:CinA family protein [Halomonas sp. Bachu 37]|uniref:CinA family protein n=1 Tax=Halomonas kashgarensis TaxID=3084920 RepID=UPI003217D366
MTSSLSRLKNLDVSLLAERLGRLCRKHGVELTTAESCTGGGVASAITGAAGSSAYFATGYVTYSNAAKTRLLGVPPELLETHGAVSEEVVTAMVAGACRESGARLGVAVSGVAGPDGGSEAKPVGTVWLAWGDGDQCETERCHFYGDRQAVREQAVRRALAGLIVAVERRYRTAQGEN